MDANHEWQALAETWQQQPAPGIDLEQVRREATRRGRQLRRTLVLETALTAVVVLLSVGMAFAPGGGYDPWLFGTMAGFLVLYQAWMISLRQRQVDDAGLDARALLDLEIRRCATALLYWRVGMWTALGMWLALYAYLFHGMDAGWPIKQTAGLVGGLVANLLVFPGMGIYGVWRCRDARRRQNRLTALRTQLGAS
jgi:hypothetical protein